MKKIIRYFKTKFIIGFLLLAAVALAAQGIPFHRVSGGIDTSAWVSNQLRVIAQPYVTTVIEGDIPGHSFKTVEGHNPQINTIASVGEQILWGVAPATQAQYVYPSSATIVNAVSTDADDTAAGTGAQQITITGLLDGYIEDTEVIALNGVTPVNSTKEFLRINGTEVTSAGSSGKNEGTITVNFSGNILSFIESGANKSLVAVYTVPAGKILFVENARGSGAGTQNVHIHIYKREFGGLFTLEKHRSVNNSPFEMTTFRFQEKTDIEGRCHADINGGTADLSLEGWIEVE